MNPDIEVEKRLIYLDSKNNKFSHDDKIKFLDDAIKNGGYYGSDGTWNSIIVFSNDNHVYRSRVETLIIKDNNFIFLKFLPRDHARYKKCTYLVPGGSIAKDVSNIDQAVNECKEEARIIVKNIQATGITYKDIVDPPKWAVETQEVNWNGNVTEVYVANYDSHYNGHIEKADEDRFMVTGKFYHIDKIYPQLRKEHKDALKVIYPNRFNKDFKNKVLTEAVNIDKEKILDEVIQMLVDAGYEPKVSKASRDAFLNNKKHIVSDGSTICISGFKDKDTIKASTLVNQKLNNKLIKCSPDNYGTIFLSIGSDVLTETALTSSERNELDSNQFGIPSLRKFPLHDKAHVIQAIRFFNTVDRKHEKELAHNIIKAMKFYDIHFSIVGERNRLGTYYHYYYENL